MKAFEEKPQKVETDESVQDIQVAIVDDDPGFSFMLKDYLLSSGGFDSDMYSNGDDFLNQYKHGDNRKIILDYDFDKGPNGLTVLQKIKAINPLSVVIIVSGQDDLEKAVETIRKGATDYFLKTNKTVFANILSSLMKIKKLEKDKLN